jgi:hypothetical protein
MRIARMPSNPDFIERGVPGEPRKNPRNGGHAKGFSYSQQHWPVIAWQDCRALQVR